MQAQLLCRAAAQEHAVHENFKILDHRAHLRVDGVRDKLIEQLILAAAADDVQRIDS